MYVWRRDPQHGFLHYHSSRMASNFTNRPSEMQSISDMDGLCTTPPLYVLAASHSISSMFSHVQKAAFTSIPHNEVRDVTASLLSEVCSNVEVEPHLQPITGEHLTLYSANSEPNPRLDLAANRGTESGEVDSRGHILMSGVFNPFVKSKLETLLVQTYRKHEREKCQKYEQHVVDIEHSSFTPLLFSATGGMSKLTSNFYRHLAERLSGRKTYALFSCNGSD